MRNMFKTLALILVMFAGTNFSNAQIAKKDLESACAKISAKTHSHFNLVHDNNVDKFAMKEDFSLEFKESVLVIHNGLNEIHVAYDSIKYASVGKPDKAHPDQKAQWFIIF